MPIKYLEMSATGFQIIFLPYRIDYIRWERIQVGLSILFFISRGGALLFLQQTTTDKRRKKKQIV